MVLCNVTSFTGGAGSKGGRGRICGTDHVPGAGIKPGVTFCISKSLGPKARDGARGANGRLGTSMIDNSW